MTDTDWLIVLYQWDQLPGKLSDINQTSYLQDMEYFPLIPLNSSYRTGGNQT